MLCFAFAPTKMIFGTKQDSDAAKICDPLSKHTFNLTRKMFESLLRVFEIDIQYINSNAQDLSFLTA